MLIAAADGAEVDISEERWERHIAIRHKELQSKFALGIDALKNPDAVYRSPRDRETRIYLKNQKDLPIGPRRYDRLALLLIVRDNCVVTAYLTSEWKRAVGERLWPS